MLRPVFRPYLALLLLLCLGRTLLPEAWVLALHSHAHTTEVAPAARPAGKELASPKHTHCHVEEFYGMAFQPALPVRLPQPRLRPFYQPLAVLAQPACPAVARPRAALRGPPRA